MGREKTSMLTEQYIPPSVHIEKLLLPCQASIWNQNDYFKQVSLTVSTVYRAQVM